MKGTERAANRIDEAPLDGVENRRLYISKAQRGHKRRQAFFGLIHSDHYERFYLSLKISFQIFSYLGYSLISSTPSG